MNHFPRTELAKEIVTALRGRNLFGDEQNGLFLAAPRRTGKSTFLQEDLQPALQAAGVIVVYVDLWADESRDPGDLIAAAIGRAIDANLGVVGKAAKKSGLESITVAGVLKIDTTKIGKPDGATLTDALRSLTESTQKPVALIVDEAQQALTSTAGDAAMRALKAARDTLNSPGRIQLMLVMSGSDRDKLLRLVNTNAAPFFGSTVRAMPLLGRDFVDYLADAFEREYPSFQPLDRAKLDAAFDILGSRPQFFTGVLGQAAIPPALGGPRYEDRVLAFARRRREDDEAQMESDFLGLSPLQKVVLWRVLEMGALFRPYDADALSFYAAHLPEVGGKATKVTAPQVQAALDAFRERTPSLVWKSVRGSYAPEDANMHRWFTERVSAGTWPPKDAQAVATKTAARVRRKPT